MRVYVNFSMSELKRVSHSLQKLKSSVGARFEDETNRLLKTISSKKSHETLSLKRDNLEKLSMELHGLEVRYGISLDHTIYHFMHSFHKN